jgi:hypothetical protein
VQLAFALRKRTTNAERVWVKVEECNADATIFEANAVLNPGPRFWNGAHKRDSFPGRYGSDRRTRGYGSAAALEDRP